MQNSQLSNNEDLKKSARIATPAYVVYESRLRRNLSLLKRVEAEAGIKIIMAFKANALWKTFPVIAEYFTSSTASSVNEMTLSLRHLGNDVHAYCPVYTPSVFPEFMAGCSHITFNSIAQFERFKNDIVKWNSTARRRVSAGLRVNPKCSVVDTDIYNPAVPGSRFGVDVASLGDELPEGIEGLHFHALCESDSYDLEKVLVDFEKKFSRFLPSLKWLNMGGGHLITRKGYDTDHFIKMMRALRQRYPNLEIIIEPGSAFTWQTGDLLTTVLDVVEDSGIKTGIIDASFACHMPDCLEMPYKPAIAEALPEGNEKNGQVYRLGGNSCLSGDFVGNWYFKSPLEVGQRLTLLDMNHYTTVKTNMFNGIQHPSIWFVPQQGEPRLLRSFTYEDYEERMD